MTRIFASANATWQEYRRLFRSRHLRLQETWMPRHEINLKTRDDD